MNRTKPSPADAGLATLLKAAQTIIANHERNDGYGAALVEIDKSVADPVERTYKLQDAEASDFESSIDREMSKLQGQPFSVRTYPATAVDRHVRYAAEGIKRKQGDFDALPAYCMFPAHLVALARKVGTPAAAQGPSLLSAAHLAPVPADAMRLNPTLDRLRAAVRESGVFL